jgi:hypothetical protein
MGYYKRISEEEQMSQNEWFWQNEEAKLANKLENYINNNKINNNNMSIIAQPSTNNNGGGQTVPAGTHVARCYQIIHIGTILDTYQGEEKLVNKVRIVFELPMETADFGKGEQPFSIGRDFTLSMHEKSGLRAFVQGWLGKSMSDGEANKFDIATLLGKEGMLNVMHRTANTGRTYADIKGASPLVKGMTCPPLVNSAFLLDYDSEDFDLRFKMLPEWLQNKVSSSKEFSDRLDRAADQMNKAKQMLEKSGLVQSADEQYYKSSDGIKTDDTEDLPF